jgi:2-polyprenyl-3-methyl-5-hydroxy-6-metoxy-1,4-benzoquinol methylase
MSFTQYEREDGKAINWAGLAREHDQRFKKVAGYVERYCGMGKKILDIGCGNVNYRLKGEVTGYDINPRELIPNAHLLHEFVKDDAKNLDKHFRPECFDCITVLELIEHIENHKTFLKDCDRILRKGGLLIISTPSPLYWKPVIGSLLFRKGVAKERAHVNCYLPRLLNMIMDGLGYDVVGVTSSRGRFYVPLISYSYLYVYRKR